MPAPARAPEPPPGGGAAGVEALLRHPGLWRGAGGEAARARALPTGFPALDERLPGGGWPLGALTEVVHAREGIGEVRLVLPALAALTGRGRWVAWVGPPHLPYAPALAAAGLEPARLLAVRAGTLAERLWAAEEALGSGACGAVLIWAGGAGPPAPGPGARALRRLQVAAARSGAWAVLHRRRPGEAGVAALRLALSPAAGGRLRVAIERCRGGAAQGAIELDPGPPPPVPGA